MIIVLLLSVVFLGTLASQGITYSMETNSYIVVGIAILYFLLGGGRGDSRYSDDGIDYANNVKCWRNGQEHDLDLTDYDGSVIAWIKGEKADGTKDSFFNDSSRAERASFIHHFGDDSDVREVTDYLENNKIAGVNTTTKAIARDTAKAIEEKHDKTVKQLTNKLDKAETELKSIGKAYASKIENERNEQEKTIIDVAPLQSNLLAR